MGRFGGEKGQEHRLLCVHFCASAAAASRKNAFLSPFKPKISPFFPNPFAQPFTQAQMRRLGKKTTAPAIRTPLFGINYQFNSLYAYLKVYALCGPPTLLPPTPPSGAVPGAGAARAGSAHRTIAARPGTLEKPVLLFPILFRFRTGCRCGQKV